MPDEGTWGAFYDPAFVLTSLQLTAHCRDVMEFGCGYGTFTIPAAHIVTGMVYALDIDPEMTTRTAEQAKQHGLLNVEAIRCDFLTDDLPLTELADYVMLFNILHAEHPELLLRRAESTLRRRPAGHNALEPRPQHSTRAKHEHSSQARGLPAVGGIVRL